MSYEIRLSDAGIEDYDRLCVSFPWFIEHIDDYLDEIAASPSDHGRRYPGGRIAADRYMQFGDYSFQVVVYFRYGLDEKHIVVTGLIVSWPVS